MKTYTKTHSSEKAAKKHKQRIKNRCGRVSETKKGSKIILKYSFPV